jgi:hypothetical protein
MNREQSRNHHYVPQWYQKRFLHPNQFTFHYLDLHPETRTSNGRKYVRRAVLPWGPDRCFCKDDLYTLRAQNWSADDVERMFFGKLDNDGRHAVELFGAYNGFSSGVVELIHALTAYMGAQRFRTPRGLDAVESLTRKHDRNFTLALMQRIFHYNTTMWSEGTWEIVMATKSPTKFIVTDEPVSFYNRKAYPSECVYPRDVPLEWVGTRTLFPLGLESCLIITHMQFVRNPQLRADVSRENARSFQQTMRYLLDTQFGRELEEDEVLRINFIMKGRAVRYIAAAEKDWLYPEKRVSTKNWSQLDHDWFLLPNPYKAGFKGGIIAGNDKGMTYAQDEHGRHPGDPRYKDQKLHDMEWEAHHRTKKEWALKRDGRSIARVDERNMNSAHDKIMAEDVEAMKRELEK